MMKMMTTTTQRHLHHRAVVWLMDDAGIAVDVFPRLFILLTATDNDKDITIKNSKERRWTVQTAGDYGNHLYLVAG